MVPCCSNTDQSEQFQYGGNGMTLKRHASFSSYFLYGARWAFQELSLQRKDVKVRRFSVLGVPYHSLLSL